MLPDSLTIPIGKLERRRRCASTAAVGLYNIKLIAHHEEGEIAVAEQVEDHKRGREEAKPQGDIHVLLSHSTHNPAVRWGRGGV